MGYILTLNADQGDTKIAISQLPGRTRVALYQTRGVGIAPLAYFTSPESARFTERFLMDLVQVVEDRGTAANRYRKALERIASAESENGCILSIGEAVTIAGEVLYNDNPQPKG